MGISKILPIAAFAAAAGICLHFDHKSQTQRANTFREEQAAYEHALHNQQGNKRMQNIIVALNGNCAADSIYDCRTARNHFEALKDIKLSFSDSLPAGATIQVFKDRLVLNSYTTELVQSKSLTKVIDYMAEQQRDGLPYGNGECFTIGYGDLQRLGKFGTRNEELLLPAPH